MKTLALTLLLVLFSSTAYATETSRSIQVYGHAFATYKADYTKIHGAIKTVSASPEEGFIKVQEDLGTLLAALSEMGLEKRDMVISLITQGPEYTWQDNTRKLTGYYSSCTIQLKVNDIAAVPKVYSELSRYPALTIRHSEYGRSDKKQLEIEVLQKALASAGKKAEALSSSIGARLGEVLHLTETSAAAPFKRPAALQATRMQGEMADSGTIGEVRIDGMVSVEYQLQ